MSNAFNKRSLVLLVVMLFIICCGFTFGGPNAQRTSAVVNSALGEINISVNESGDSIVRIMEDVQVSKNTVVDGDVVAIMGNVHVDGTVNGSVVAVMGDVIADGKIGGDAVAVLGDIKANSVIQGDAVSAGGNIIKGPEGQILGQAAETSIAHIPSPLRRGIHWGFSIFALVLTFGLASLTLALMPVQVKNMSRSLENDPLRKFLIGFVAFILTPFIILITAVSIIGLPLVPVLILALAAAIFIGYVGVAFFVGQRIGSTTSGQMNIFLELLLGVLVLWVVRQIPILGFLISVLLAVYALGLVLDTKFGTDRPWFGGHGRGPVDAPAAPPAGNVGPPAPAAPPASSDARPNAPSEPEKQQ